MLRLRFGWATFLKILRLKICSKFGSTKCSSVDKVYYTHRKSEKHINQCLEYSLQELCRNNDQMGHIGPTTLFITVLAIQIWLIPKLDNKYGQCIGVEDLATVIRQSCHVTGNVKGAFKFVSQLLRTFPFPFFALISGARNFFLGLTKIPIIWKQYSWIDNTINVFFRLLKTNTLFCRNVTHIWLLSSSLAKSCRGRNAPPLSISFFLSRCFSIRLSLSLSHFVHRTLTYLNYTRLIDHDTRGAKPRRTYTPQSQ